MNAPERTSALHSDSLAREIADQLQSECDTVIAEAQAEADAILSAAHGSARARMHAAIIELRREGAQRVAQAQAQMDTETRLSAQRHAAAAIREALPLLRDALTARWRDKQSRRHWTGAAAGLCTARLHPGAWRVIHPADWPADEQEALATALGRSDLTFEADTKLNAGLTIESDGAILDAAPAGLLADEGAIAAQLLCEIEAAS